MMEKLDLELVIDAEGHLTEVGATALADGQDELLPDGAASHAERCEACAALVGEQALRSAAAREALPVQRQPQRAPWWALLAAAALAVVGAMPAAGEARQNGLALLRVGPPMAMALRSALSGPEVEAAIERSRWASAAVLGATAVAMAMLVRSRRDRSEGEVK